ncbi:MAG: OmpA family protein [Gammaproteobacteria bacterium]|nr:OmpA family protein [Gammaproteobacteria bacterium]
MLPRLFVTLPLMLACLPCPAGVRAYGASIDESVWRMDKGAGACRLSQRVPLYGTAQFVSRGSRDIEFALRLERGTPEGGGWARVRTVAPLWQPGVLSRELGLVPVQHGLQPFRLGADMAWRVLAELEQGMFPTFSLGEERGEPVTVALSAVNFLERYPSFLACIDTLGAELRSAAESAAREAAKPLDSVYAEDAPNRATLFFATDSAELTPSALDVLGKLSAFIKQQPKIEVVIIDGHADDRGGLKANLKLSERRAQAIKDYLVGNTGLEPIKLRTRAYGEKYPAVPSKDAAGQARNRRVLLMVQLPAPGDEKEPIKQLEKAVETMNAIETVTKPVILGEGPTPAEPGKGLESQPVIESKKEPKE